MEEKKRKFMRIVLMTGSLQETPSVCGHSIIQRRWDASVLKIKVSA